MSHAYLPSCINHTQDLHLVIMRKELSEETVKVSSQSMPNLTNIFRIGREVVKSNIYVDDEDTAMRPACAATLSVNTE